MKFLFKTSHLQSAEITTGQPPTTYEYKYYQTPWEEEETPTKVDGEATRKDEVKEEEEATLIKEAVPTPAPVLMLPRRKS